MHMISAQRSSRAIVLAALFSTIAAACVDREQPTAPKTPPAPSLTPLVEVEGELLGNIYQSGDLTNDAGYYYNVIPTADTWAYLNEDYFTATMWADTGAVYMLNYTDPVAGGPCGSTVANYLAGIGIANEVHRPGPGQTPSGAEKHCIRPGKYRIQLLHNGEPVPGKDFVLDYLAAARNAYGGFLTITNTSRGNVTELAEPLHYNAANLWTDTHVNFDVTGGTYSETPLFYAQNIGLDTMRSTFTDQSTLSGIDIDNFRFNLAGSAASWNLSSDSSGKFLARLFYDQGRPLTDQNHTNYYDPRSTYDPPNAAGIMRVHAFAEHMDSSRTATVAVEMMLPDESADGAINTTRSVAITRLACTPNVESTNSFRNADQYAGIGCSARGANIRYSWQFESGQWTPETADTSYDFLGYGTMTPNPRQVRLKVRNTTTGDTSVSNITSVSLADSVLTASGPSDVWDKTAKTYTSNRVAQWFERFNPSLAWGVITSQYVSSIQRIWPAGNYTVDVRASDLRNGVLRRGRQPVTVCTPGPCGLMAGATTASTQQLEWHLLGGGPWVSWGTPAAPRLIRFYELMGMHDGPSSFTGREWLTSSASGAVDAAGTFNVTFANRQTEFRDALVVDFSLTPAAGAGSYVFGVALDPDVGSSAADDEGGFDSKRGLVYVSDKTSAAGYLLLENDGSALYSVDQYGTHRFAPSETSVNWQAQRTKGLRLLAGRSDVQLVISGAAESAAATYTLVLLRGSTVAEIQSRADEVLAALAATR